LFNIKEDFDMTKRAYFVVKDLENQKRVAAAVVQFGLNSPQELWSLLARNQVPFSLPGIVADYARAYAAAMRDEKVNLHVVAGTFILSTHYPDFRQICISEKTGEVDVEQTVVWMNRSDHGWLDKLIFGEVVYYLANCGQILRFLGGQTPMAKLRDFLVANYDSSRLQKVCADLDIDPGSRIFSRSASATLVVETVLQYVESERPLRKQFLNRVKAVWPESRNLPDWK